MNFIIALLIVLELICCLLLIGIILLQKSKSEGLGMAFGAGAGESLFGARAGNVLSKITVVLGCVFLANTLVLGMLFAQREKTLMDDVPAQETPAAMQSQPGDALDLAVPAGQDSVESEGELLVTPVSPAVPLEDSVAVPAEAPAEM